MCSGKKGLPMDKILDIFRNKWFKRAVSLLSLGFPAFLLYVDWLSFAYYLQPVNNVPLFLVYVLVNFVFAGIMFYTRKQLITQLVTCISPIIAFILLIISFGQWYLIVPPVVICAVTFLAAGSNETLKTILGTVYLLMFVVGTLVYLTMLHFNLTVQTLANLTECDISKRSENYTYSPDYSYRIVMYIDDAGDERSLTSYYVEKTEDDISLPYLNCYKHINSQKVLVTMDKDSVIYKWLTNDDLYIDGRAKNIPKLFEQAEEAARSTETDDNTEDSDEIVKTYYEEHDYNDEEYFGPAETVASAVNVTTEPESAEQNYE